MFHPSNTEVASDNIALWLSKIAKTIFIISLGLSPILFVPSVYLPIGYSKVMLVLVGLSLAFVFHSLSMLRNGQMTIRLPLVILAFLGVVAATATSAVLSGDMADAFYGNVMGVQTVSFIAILVAVTIGALFLRDSKDMIIRLYMLLVLSGLLLAVFHLVRLFFGAEFMSAGGLFGNLVSGPLGSWNDLALYFGLVVLLILVALEQLPLTRVASLVLSVITVLSLAMLAIVNFTFVWIILGVVSLIILMYGLTKNRFSNVEQLSLEGSSSRSIVAVVLSVLVFIVSASFVISGSVLGSFINESTGISYIEVRPSLTATFDIARHTLAESPVLGIGPNKFVDAWRLYKDQNINTTIFWNTSFESGNGYLTTMLVTVGGLGVLAWVLFYISILYTGFKAVYQLTLVDRFWKFILISSLVSSLYLWGMAIVYVPSVTVLILASCFTGLFVAVYSRFVTMRSWHLSVMDTRGFGLSLVALSLFIIFTAIGSVYFFGQNYLALYNFNQTVNTVEAGDNLDTVLSGISQSYQISGNDAFAREIAGYSYLQMESLLNTPESENANLAELFQTAAANGVNAIKLATEQDYSEPQNWQLEAQIYGLLASAGVEGAKELAETAVARARQLDPKNPQLPLLAAQIQARSNDLEAARRLAEEAITLKSNYVEAIIFLTQLDISESKTADAIARSRSLITLEPNNPARYYQLGVLYSADGKLPEAISALEQAVVLNPNFANARYLLALAYGETDKVDAAKAQLEVVLSLNPGNETVMLLLSEIEKNGKLPSAVAPDVVSEAGVGVGEAGQVSSNEAPDTPLVTTVNNVSTNETTNPEESTSTTAQ